jgi:hypothetical protein
VITTDDTSDENTARTIRLARTILVQRLSAYPQKRGTDIMTEVGPSFELDPRVMYAACGAGFRGKLFIAEA